MSAGVTSTLGAVGGRLGTCNSKIKSVMTMAKMPSLNASIRFLPISKDAALLVIGDLPLLNSFGTARFYSAASRAGMGLLDRAAQVEVRWMELAGLRRVDELVGVVVHLAAALWTDHFAVCHWGLLFNHRSECFDWLSMNGKR
jgi:hypothetical protein